MDKLSICRTCSSQVISKLCDYGMQPRSFDYWDASVRNRESVFPFSLCQCGNCGTIQLEDPLSPGELIPKYDWLSNKEPDSHHKDLAELILGTLPSEAKVLTVARFDNKIFDVLSKQIGHRVCMLESQLGFEVDPKASTQAALHGYFSHDNFNPPAEWLGAFDIVISTRMLEHAEKPREFVELLRRFLVSDGQLVLEVPDCTKPLLQGDVAMLWEEHTNYYTPESLRRGLDSLGFDVVRSVVYFFQQEDALAGFFQKKQRDKTGNISELLKGNPSDESEVGLAFKEKIERWKVETRFVLNKVKKEGGKVIIFGAGHRTVAFINLLGIAELVSGVIDDDPNKQGLCLPGSSIRIENSGSLSQMSSGICLLSVNLMIEEKIVEIIHDKAGHNIGIHSISPDSPRTLSLLWKA
jgi:hypothetical protein